jgi:hypothetical protein
MQEREIGKKGLDARRGSITVTKAKRDAGLQHMGDGKYRHQPRTIGKIRYQQSAGSMWMTEFSISLMLWACDK